MEDTMATATTEHYRAYSPKPFTRAERDSVTVLFGGLHWRIERIIQAVLEGGGNKVRVLPVATRKDLLTGREVADIGQCSPTSFTTGNLVNFLKKEAKEIVAVELLYKTFRNRPRRESWRSIVWHLTTPYFAKALREIRRKFSAIEVDRLRVKPKVKITGEFYLQTVEGEPNYNIHRWLEAEGAEVYPAAVSVWMDYLLRLGLQKFEDYSGIERSARIKLGAGPVVQKLYRGLVARLRHALGDLPHAMPQQLELRRLAAPYFHSRLDGGEGDMLVGKALWAHLGKKAHMICQLSPYSCMPNTMSIGAMAGVIGKYPDLLYAPLEIKGDAEVHALSRCQMILTEAKKRAQREFDDVLARTGLTVDEVRASLDAHPEMKRATYRVPHGDAAGTAADLVLHVADRLGRR